MNLISFMGQSAGLTYLIEAALRALILACITALVVALMPGKRAVVRLYIWTGVLYVALGMPLLGALLPSVRLAVPASVWNAAAPKNAVVTTVTPEQATAANAGVPGHKDRSAVADPEAHQNMPSKPAFAPQRKPDAHAIVVTNDNVPAEASQLVLLRIMERLNWKTIVGVIYLAGVAILLIRLLLGLLGSRRLAASPAVISTRYFLRKDEIEDASSSAALGLLSTHARLAGLKNPPRLKESAALSVPATIGLRQPVILLPSGWRSWTRDKLEAVLAHEISHVARRDALTQLLSLVYRAIFWFSPVSWWLDRRLTELAEQASDEAALAGGADRTLYAETLLGFFAQLESAAGRIRWQALCMANRDHAGRAERRIDRILDWKAATSMRKSFIVSLIVLAVPVVFVAASLHPFVATMQSQSRLSQPSQPATAATVKNENPSAALVSENSFPAAPVVATQETPAKTEEVQQEDEPSRERKDSSFFYGYGSRYVIMTGNSKNVSMSGSNEDLQHALALRKKINGDFVWFERDEKSYIITDPAFIAKAVALFAPQNELGRKQDELGRQQDELGRQQDALGEQMEKITVKVPDITAELERIRANLKELQASGATQTELGSIQSKLGELQSRIGQFQSDAGRQQSGIGRQQSELGKKQGELGKQQGELGRQQAELSRQISRELGSMFDEAIVKGIAKPE